MKSNRKKRIIAAVLCMVMVLTSNISALAGGEIFVDTPAAVEELSSEPAAVTETEPEVSVSDTETITETETLGMFSAQSVSGNPAGSESTAPSGDMTAEASAGDVFSDGDAVVDMIPVSEAEISPAPENEVQVSPTPEIEAEVSPTPEAEASPTPEPEDDPSADFGDGADAEDQVLSGATELRQEFVDTERNVTQRVTANLPMGAFAAETSAVTMEVSYLDTDSANYVKSMMTELLPEGMQLGEYVFFNVEFKVNGETAEPLEPITITVEGSNLTITDTKRANVFYLRKANPEVEGDKDELKEISQRAEVLERLQAAGESTENIEDYDLSEITLREDGTTDKIIFEGRKSTIYGCYVEEEKPTEDTTPEEEQPVENPEQGTEEANPETATEVEIISDDVNLRTQPDAEADNVAAVAHTGERYPLLETVEAGEATWYKIQYTSPETGEVSELYVRSDFVKLVEGVVEVTDDETVEVTEMVTELTYEDEQVSVVVSAAEEGIIPEGAKLSVTPITADNEDTKAQYDEVAQHVGGKVSEKEKEVVGFLAYDITFVNEKGEKVEPNGEVKVTMDYKQPLIPREAEEAIAGKEQEPTAAETEIQDATIETAESFSSGEETPFEDRQESQSVQVTVMHLEEDETGAVTEVVDMTENSQVETLDVTEAQEVQKAEFVTDSFSVYTITWIDSSGSSQEKKKCRIYMVDESGKVIGTRQEKEEEVEGTGNIMLAQYAEKIDGYTFDHAVLSEKEVTEENGEFSTDLSKAVDATAGVERISYNNGWWYDWENNRWTELDTDKQVVYAYLVYNSAGTHKVTEKSTINADAENIEINLLNYNSNINKNEFAEAGFKFHSMRKGKDNDIYYVTPDEPYTEPGNQILHQGYVKYNLVNGSPVLSNETSLSTLFDGTATGAEIHSGVDGLLTKNGTEYSYDSSQNHAQYNSSKNKLEVYNARLTPNQAIFGYGNFLPFNNFPSYASNGNLYSVPGRLTYTDMWFGMNIGFDFYQPKDGLVNDQEMMFQFSGDDDVWVFIDGVKVLDIGGIHDRMSGSINFATGDVYVGGIPTTIADCFREAYNETYKVYPNDAYLSTIFVKENGKYRSFKNFSSHRLEFFYLERGAGASNCKLDFNMPTLDKDEIIVEKEISNYDNGAYSDVEFEFKLYTKNELNEDVPAKDISYTLKKADETRVTAQTDSGGGFKLKHKEQAIFNAFPQGTEFYVAEVGVNSSEYDEVVIESAGIVNEGGESIVEGNNAVIRSKILTVGINSLVLFQNKCNESNLQNLYIKKIYKGPENQDIYTVRVTLGGALYKGEYRVGYDFASVGTAGKTFRTENGLITLQKNQVAVIMGNVTIGDKKGIPSKTTFKVEEIELEQLTGLGEEPYQQPIYAPVDGTVGDIIIERGSSDDKTYGSVTGKVLLSQNPKLTITNEIINPTKLLTITKTDVSAKVLAGAEFALYGSKNEGANLVKDESIIIEETTSTAAGIVVEKLDLSYGTYFLTELKAPDGYQCLAGDIKIVVSEEGVECYKADGSEMEVSELTEGTDSIYKLYVQNHLLYDLPSTGGSGIFGYMIGGVALMMAAMFILYKMRSKGVLRS